MKPSNDMDKLDLSTFIFILILALVTLALQLILIFYYINIVPIGITLINFVLLFSYMIVSFYSLTRINKLNIATRDLENAESYNNSLTVLYDNVKGFKHDFDNMISIMAGFIAENDMSGLKRYYNDLKKDCESIKNIQILNPNIINNPGIYNLIVAKYKKAEDLGININFEIFFDFDNLKMPIYEFSRILGILFDNAIEASKESADKKINIIFRDSQKSRVQIFIIENTFADKDVDISKIFEKGVSGKENHSGIGLWEVQRIVSHNSSTILNTTKSDVYFKQELQINY